jgi:acyl-CoA synthetase (AMP-forming)/AMP-acid ligase II
MAGFQNLGDLIGRERDLAKIAIIDLGGEGGRERTYTYGDVDAFADGVARSLLARGLRRGDRVAILSANRAEYLFAYYGIMRAGLVAVPISSSRIAAPSSSSAILPVAPTVRTRWIACASASKGPPASTPFWIQAHSTPSCRPQTSRP